MKEKLTHYFLIMIFALGVMGSGNELDRTMIESSKEQRPKNMARLNVGTRIELTFKDGKEGGITREVISSLLSEDVSLACLMEKGKSGFIFSLSSIHKINRASFQNDGCEGIVKVSFSNTLWPVDSSRWNSTSKTKSITHLTEVELDFGFSDSKYARVEFDLTKSGLIFGFGVFGGVNEVDFKLKKAGLGLEKSGSEYQVENSMNLDFLGSYSESEVIYVSSKPHEDSEKDVGYMTDDRMDTSYGFSPEDQNPTWIIDLKEKRDLSRVVFALQAPAGMVKLFLLEKLPSQDTAVSFRRRDHDHRLSWMSGLLFSALGSQLNLPNTDGLPQKINVSDRFYSERSPAGTYTLEGGKKTFSIDFESSSANYLLIRFQPESLNAGEKMTVFKICAFGPVKPEKNQYVILYEPRSALVQNVSVSLPENRRNEDYDPKVDPKVILKTEDLLPPPPPVSE